MRVAVFTNQFPAPVSTFFARDMQALLAAGLDVQIFALYPRHDRFWRFVPTSAVGPAEWRGRVHHATPGRTLAAITPWLPGEFARMARLAGPICTSAIRYGAAQVVKSAYAVLQARLWAERFPEGFDRVLAYWGNYAATCAYAYHRLSGSHAPFSIMLHAGTDLYRSQVYLAEKLDYADRIFVVCEFNRRFLRELAPDRFEAWSPKIAIHHPGLDLGEYVFHFDGRPPALIVGVGGLYPAKGYDDLVTAVGELSRRGVPVRLQLVGDGPLAASLGALARRLGVADRVTFSGWLSPEEARQAIAGATLLVHPSRGLGDAVPTVVKEAMALGTPVIASNVAGFPSCSTMGARACSCPPAIRAHWRRPLRPCWPIQRDESVTRRSPDAGSRRSSTSAGTGRGWQRRSGRARGQGCTLRPLRVCFLRASPGPPRQAGGADPHRNPLRRACVVCGMGLRPRVRLGTGS